ncbi:MMPL family transporter [Streptomyces ficellus]|uniref:MMPL family transporter n=1 Tax=Streptomyces ficellus TaxID=1977088 RepID=A0ABT7ZDJ8_9ACTN|nr:MMPL family transporter [Streptomyces ficellus]MDN3297569.1 MMPL family transporter [Streptomyces ficellus]
MRRRLLPAEPLDSLARLVLRFPVRTLVLTACVLLAAGVAAVGVSDKLYHGGTTAPGAESARAERTLATAFGGGSPTVTLVATTDGSVDDPAVVRAGTRLAERARRLPKVVDVRSYWPRRAPALRGRGGHTALVELRVATTQATAHKDVEPLLAELTGRHGPLRVGATGTTPVGLAIERQSRLDLRRTELLAAPLTACVLVVVFGGVVAAGLALLVGLAAVVGATAVLSGVSGLTTVSVIALNLTTALGFALAVDFSLFILARYREERRRYREERDPHEAAHQALVATVCTTGRTVVCSALTVIGSLVALLLFPLGMLRSIAYGGIAVVALSALLAITALPAALLLLGPRIDALSVRRRGLRASPDSGRWYRLAYAVMRRPVPVVLVLGVVLTALVLPFSGARFGTFDDRALPRDSPTRHATDTLRRDFDHHAMSPVQVVLPGLDARGGARALDGYARHLARLEHVARVETATGTYRDGRRLRAAEPGHGYASAAGVWAAVITDVGPETSEGVEVVRAVRAVSSPVPALVGGTQAWLADLRDSIRARVVPAMSLIAVVTLLVLGWCTRSLVLPIKALALNVLSLSATFGVMVLVFQQGHLREWLGGFTVTGVTDSFVPVLVLCVAFGLSMDYEVLLLSRTVEEHEAGASTRQAVARAVQQTAGLFTASALVVIVVMAALAASGLLLLKVVGVSLAVAVFVDATVIRLLLAPALMALLGRANWWLPARRTPATVRV